MVGHRAGLYQAGQPGLPAPRRDNPVHPHRGAPRPETRKARRQVFAPSPGHGARVAARYRPQGGAPAPGDLPIIGPTQPARSRRRPRPYPATTRPVARPDSAHRPAPGSVDRRRRRRKAPLAFPRFSRARRIHGKTSPRAHRQRARVAAEHQHRACNFLALQYEANPVASRKTFLAGNDDPDLPLVTMRHPT